MCDQLQHSGTLRGADVITDHGAEHVAIVQRIPVMSTILQLVVSNFLPFTLFFVFSGVIRPLRAKKKEKRNKCFSASAIFYIKSHEKCHNTG